LKKKNNPESPLHLFRDTFCGKEKNKRTSVQKNSDERFETTAPEKTNIQVRVKRKKRGLERAAKKKKKKKEKKICSK